MFNFCVLHCNYNPWMFAVFWLSCWTAALNQKYNVFKIFISRLEPWALFLSWPTEAP